MILSSGRVELGGISFMVSVSTSNMSVDGGWMVDGGMFDVCALAWMTWKENDVEGDFYFLF